MIYSLRGKLIYSDNQSFVIECGGVGYRCAATLKTLAKLPANNENTFVYTLMNVREDSVDLFGFYDKEELEMFKLVTSVNGVGAKIGIAILSEYTCEQFALYVSSGDAKALTKATGVGAKLAQRIVLEIKDKISTSSSVGDLGGGISLENAKTTSKSKEAVEALVALGYSQSDAVSTVSKIDGDLSTSEIIKEALKLMSRRF